MKGTEYTTTYVIVIEKICEGVKMTPEEDESDPTFSKGNSIVLNCVNKAINETLTHHVESWAPPNLWPLRQCDYEERQLLVFLTPAIAFCGITCEHPTLYNIF